MEDKALFELKGVKKMLIDGINIELIPNCIIKESSQEFCNKVAEDYYKLLKNAQVFPKYVDSKVCSSDFPMTNQFPLFFRRYLDLLSKACEYQNQFYGVHLINFDSTNNIDSEILSTFVGFVSKHISCIKFVFANPDKPLADYLEQNGNCILLQEKNNSIGGDYIDSYCNARNIQCFNEKDKKLIRDILSEISYDCWESCMNSIIRIFYEESNEEKFISRLINYNIAGSKKKQIGFRR